MNFLKRYILALIFAVNVSLYSGNIDTFTLAPASQIEHLSVSLEYLQKNFSLTNFFDEDKPLDIETLRLSIQKRLERHSDFESIIVTGETVRKWLDDYVDYRELFRIFEFDDRGNLRECFKIMDMVNEDYTWAFLHDAKSDSVVGGKLGLVDKRIFETNLINGNKLEKVSEDDIIFYKAKIIQNRRLKKKYSEGTDKKEAIELNNNKIESIIKWLEEKWNMSGSDENLKKDILKIFKMTERITNVEEVSHLDVLASLLSIGMLEEFKKVQTTLLTKEELRKIENKIQISRRLRSMKFNETGGYGLQNYENMVISLSADTENPETPVPDPGCLLLTTVRQLEDIKADESLMGESLIREAELPIFISSKFKSLNNIALEFQELIFTRNNKRGVEIIKEAVQESCGMTYEQLQIYINSAGIIGEIENALLKSKQNVNMYSLINSLNMIIKKLTNKNSDSNIIFNLKKITNDLHSDDINLLEIIKKSEDVLSDMEKRNILDVEIAADFNAILDNMHSKILYDLKWRIHSRVKSLSSIWEKFNSKWKDADKPDFLNNLDNLDEDEWNSVKKQLVSGLGNVIQEAIYDVLGFQVIFDSRGIEEEADLKTIQKIIINSINNIPSFNYFTGKDNKNRSNYGYSESKTIVKKSYEQKEVPVEIQVLSSYDYAIYRHGTKAHYVYKYAQKGFRFDSDLLDKLTHRLTGNFYNDFKIWYHEITSHIYVAVEITNDKKEKDYKYLRLPRGSNIADVFFSRSLKNKGFAKGKITKTFNGNETLESVDLSEAIHNGDTIYIDYSDVNGSEYGIHINKILKQSKNIRAFLYCLIANNPSIAIDSRDLSKHLFRKIENDYKRILGINSNLEDIDVKNIDSMKQQALDILHIIDYGELDMLINILQNKNDEKSEILILKIANQFFQDFANCYTPIKNLQELRAILQLKESDSFIDILSKLLISETKGKDILDKMLKSQYASDKNISLAENMKAKIQTRLHEKQFGQINISKIRGRLKFLANKLDVTSLRQLSIRIGLGIDSVTKLELIKQLENSIFYTLELDEKSEKEIRSNSDVEKYLAEPLKEANIEYSINGSILLIIDEAVSEIQNKIHLIINGISGLIKKGDAAPNIRIVPKYRTQEINIKLPIILNANVLSSIQVILDNLNISYELQKSFQNQFNVITIKVPQEVKIETLKEYLKEELNNLNMKSNIINQIKIEENHNEPISCETAA